MSTRSTSSNLFSPLRDPESLIRRRNLGELSSLFEFEEVMSIPHNNMGPPPAGPPPPPNNGPPSRYEETNTNDSNSVDTKCKDLRGGPHSFTGVPSRRWLTPPDAVYAYYE
ncbi:hypothetical protein Tco_0727021 [Tanacetum coccineum]|uniref:Uncharacterized protein n=1 Tax=Tanacetum coccineum TaxID=301880 RepID=A0ABQ4YJH4_9ASTR